MEDSDSKSKQSAKECRKRKKLRYQTLEAIAQREEAAIAVLYQELEQMKLLFEQLDRGEVTLAEAHLRVTHLRRKAPPGAKSFVAPLDSEAAQPSKKPQARHRGSVGRHRNAADIRTRQSVRMRQL
uniref:BZIP domain-containing protein n=1 Tax=Macrostomum lignano TaxID=282301 RepID=A0A1I8F1H8_9PLAT